MIAGDLTAFLRARVEAIVGGHVADDDDLFELGLDSLEAVEITGEIEDRWHLALDPELLFDHPTIAAVVGAVAAARTGS